MTEIARIDKKYFGAILCVWGAFYGLATIGLIADPTSMCGPPEAICCIGCGLFLWVCVFPIVGFLLLALIFAPGFLIAIFVARKIRGWRSFYWIFS